MHWIQAYMHLRNRFLSVERVVQKAAKQIIDQLAVLETQGFFQFLIPVTCWINNSFVKTIEGDQVYSTSGCIAGKGKIFLSLSSVKTQTNAYTKASSHCDVADKEWLGWSCCMVFEKRLSGGDRGVKKDKQRWLHTWQQNQTALCPSSTQSLNFIHHPPHHEHQQQRNVYHYCYLIRETFSLFIITLL